MCLCPWSADAQKCLDEANSVLSSYDGHFRELAEELKLDCEIFNPDDAYDDDYQLIEGRVRIHIAMLVGSIPNATPGNPEAYIGMMVEEVMTEDISLPALELACSQIRRRVKFTPSISEVIEAIQEQAELWEPRLNAIHGCEDYATWLRDKLRIATELVAAEQVKREEQRLAAEEKKRVDAELRAQPLGLGDRVRWRNDEPFDPTFLGTITKQWQYSDGFDVFFDIGRNYYVERKDLERVIPGDRGHAMTPQAEKKLAEERIRLLRTQRPVVGDRVTDDIHDWTDPDDPPHGAGTVLFAHDFEPGDYDDGFTVRFDSGGLGENYMACQLRRLLPGDPDFVAIGAGESACAVSCEEATTLAPHPRKSTGVAAARSGAVSHERSNQTGKESK